MALNSNTLKYGLRKSVKCCVHGHKCSVARKMMLAETEIKMISTETLTCSETSSESVSFEEQKLLLPRLQQGKSFADFKFFRFLNQEYICERTKDSKTIEENSAFPIKRYYIGIVIPSTAELFVSRNTAFRVYHSIKEINDNKMSLCIVYKNSRGDFYLTTRLCRNSNGILTVKSNTEIHVVKQSHYLIKERFDENLRTNLLYVDCGEEEPPEFIGIEALIKYYTIYASLHSFSLANGLSVDVFPWWHLISNV